MNGNNRSAYRRKEDSARSLLIGGIVLVSIAIATVGFFLSAELFGWFDKPPVNNTINSETPVAKFNTTELEVLGGDVHKGDLILINETYKYVFPESEISPVSILDTTLRKKHTYTNAAGETKEAFSYYSQSYDGCAQLELETLKALIAWTDAFSITNNNIDLFIYNEDGYRTAAKQEALYAKKPTSYATSGASEHHTGKVIDLYGQVSSNDPIHRLDDAVYKATYQWLYDNAYKYGFVLRYPAEKAATTGVEYEPYHFRQVGYAHAYYMYKNNLCLEEYLELLRGRTAEAPLEFKGDDGNKYMVYYQAASAEATTKLTVPADYSYTVSGDNMGGFIVTVNVGK